MNFNQMLKQAQQMQRKVDKAKKEYEAKEFEFVSQQEIVSGKLNGKAEILELHIKDEFLTVDNKEMLEDLIVVTVNENVKKVLDDKEKMCNTITNGVDVSAFL